MYYKDRPFSIDVETYRPFSIDKHTDRMSYWNTYPLEAMKGWDDLKQLTEKSCFV